jgi:hypothetical protein
MSSKPTTFSLKMWLDMGQEEYENYKTKYMLFSGKVRESRRYLITKLKICQEFCEPGIKNRDQLEGPHHSLKDSLVRGEIRYVLSEEMNPSPGGRK